MPHALKPLLAFLMPLTVAAYVWSAPHAPLEIVLLALPLAVAIALDAVAGPDRSPPGPRRPSAVFHVELAALAALHAANLAGLVWMTTQAPTALDLLAAVVLSGASTGYTAIVLAHELIHRRQRGWRLLGRALLASALYEHFFTEHLRGHHARVATAADPATARYDEAFVPFFLRTVPGQLCSAWALERRRTGGRLWENRVVHGAIAGWGALLAVGLVAGPQAAAAWLGQAFVGVLLLEVVNYFEHWGLERAGGRVATRDSWDAESWFTTSALVGLSRHADHHAHPTRPFHALRPAADSPKLPWGYFATGVAALFWNAGLRARLRAELRRTGLGPFHTASEPA